MKDIHAELAAHNIKVQERDHEAWAKGATENTFACELVNRNRFAFAYTAAILGCPLEINYSHVMGPRRRANCWLLPITVAEAQQMGITPNWRYNSVTILLNSGGQQTEYGQISWFSSDGRSKGVSRPRKLDLVIMGAADFNAALHNAHPA